MKPSSRARRGAALLALSLVGAGVSVVTGPLAQAAPAAEKPRPGDVAAASAPLLDKPLRGRKALRGLGDRVAEAAARNDLTTSELRTLLREDDTVWVDQKGSVFFVDPAPAPQTGTPEPAVASAPLAETFALHSNPDSSLTILLDFDGAQVSGSPWNSSPYNVTPGAHPAWDPDGNGAAFSDAELRKVQQVWAAVAEDFAPFDVDVTTEDPGTAGLVRSSLADGEYGIRVLVTPSDDPFAKICGRQCGGVAYLDVFARVNSVAQPAWVFPQALGNDPKSVAEAVSHEAGHNLALDHDGTANSGYYLGHGLWAPIMGAGYNRPLSQWSAGSYTDADNQQDDLSILRSRLGSRADEAGDAVATSSPLPAGTAYIGTTDDVDSYLLGTCEQGALVDVQPPGAAPNVDVRLAVHDATGTRVSTHAPGSSMVNRTTAAGLGATIAVPAAGSGWVLTVEGVGQDTWATNGYDDYGSLGAYTVQVTGCDGAPDTGVPGAPGGLTTDGGAATTSLTLSWSAPADPGDGPVTGYVVGRLGTADIVTVGPEVRSHTFTGLEAGTTYDLSVRAVNAAGTGPAAWVSARTAEPGPPANDAVADAEVLVGDAGSVAGDNTRATGEATDPTPPSSYAAGGHSVWYAWTAPARGSVSMSTSGGDDNRDTTLGVYTGVPGALTEVAGNDDADSGGLHAAVTFDAVAGTRYLVAVDGFEELAGGRGPFTLGWSLTRTRTAPAAPHDVVAHAGDGAAVVSWGTPDDNGSPLTSYAVTLRADGQPDRTETVDASRTGTSVTGLANGTTYRVTVRATNDVGTSPESAAATVVPVAPVSPSPSPSPTPTETPTAGPTETPAPTAGPTMGPTAGPTAGPTVGPTVGPTAGPVIPSPGKPRPPKVRVRGKRVTLTWAVVPDAPVTSWVLDLAKGRDRKVKGKVSRAQLKLKPGRHKVRIGAVTAGGKVSWSRWVKVRVR
ncbi:fibronectin type III domain-containing protein [Nocardioides solisilvae]|uniref:fibronectin type III domain-containing protein n=1 Tax=Nocardioides solisilvae TaxID=1542435 RepID=UPI000D744266|nr:fibronectin type III domain-containing protein [Nocardioides solisilvae]